MLKVPTATGDLILDRKIKDAMTKIRELTENKTLRERIVLIRVLYAVIGYRIAVHLKSSDQQQWLHESDRLYDFSLKDEIKREEAIEMSKQIMEIMTIETARVTQPNRKGGRKR